MSHDKQGALEGSGVVLSRVMSPPIWVISIVTLLITLPIATHEPPSLQRLAARSDPEEPDKKP